MLCIGDGTAETSRPRSASLGEKQAGQRKRDEFRVKKLYLDLLRICRHITSASAQRQHAYGWKTTRAIKTKN